jgi:hypothetical protein
VFCERYFSFYSFSIAIRVTEPFMFDGPIAKITPKLNLHNVCLTDRVKGWGMLIVFYLQKTLHMINRVPRHQMIRKLLALPLKLRGQCGGLAERL